MLVRLGEPGPERAVDRRPEALPEARVVEARVDRLEQVHRLPAAAPRPERRQVEGAGLAGEAEGAAREARAAAEHRYGQLAADVLREQADRSPLQQRAQHRVRPAAVDPAPSGLLDEAVHRRGPAAEIAVGERLPGRAPAGDVEPVEAVVAEHLAQAQQRPDVQSRDDHGPALRHRALDVLEAFDPGARHEPRPPRELALDGVLLEQAAGEAPDRGPRIVLQQQLRRARSRRRAGPGAAGTRAFPAAPRGAPRAAPGAAGGRSGSSRARATRPAGGGTSRWFFGRSASASASSRSGAVERCTGAVYGAASEGWNSGLRGYSRAMRFSAVVALGLVCLGTFLGLAACGGGTSTGTQTHPAGTAAPQGEMRAPQSRRGRPGARPPRAAPARGRPLPPGRGRSRLAAGPSPSRTSRTSRFLRPPRCGRRAFRLPRSRSRSCSASRTTAASAGAPTGSACSPSRRRPARGSCARTSTGGRWRRRGRRTRATRSTPPTTSPTSTSCSGTPQQRGLRILLTIWGTPRLGERRRRPQPRADAGVRPRGLRPRRRGALLRHARRLPVRAVLLGLERAEPRAVPRAAVRRPRPAGGAGDLRAALPGRVRRDQEREPRRRGRDRRDLAARARLRRARASRRRSRPGGSRSSSRGSGRAFASTPGRTTRTRPRPASHRPRSPAGRT